MFTDAIKKARENLVDVDRDRCIKTHSWDQRTITIALTGSAIAREVDNAISYFRNALDEKKEILVDLSKTQFVDPRFFGLFLMVRKQLLSPGNGLRFTGVIPRIKRIFCLNGFEFLLDASTW
jgi:N-acetylglucosaminyldiphosphoundecaprenol N-acetyl-beta-D-mannosaminyltransferase